MDVIKFNPSAPGKMEHGEIVNKIKKKMWVERYREPGEFSFIAPGSSNLDQVLPIGSFVTHVDSTDIMRVENHEISAAKGKEAEIKVTGRSLDHILEFRVIGSSSFDGTAFQWVAVGPFIPGTNYSWIQTVYIIDKHIVTADDPDNNIPFLTVDHASGISTSGEPQEPNTVKPGESVAKTVLDFLDISNLGLRVIRPGVWSPLGASSPNVLFRVYKGTSKATSVIFTHAADEIESADYFWSNRGVKTNYLVQGKWIKVMTGHINKGYDRRQTLVEAADIDEQYDTGLEAYGDASPIMNKMLMRGSREGKANRNKEIIIAKAEVARDTRYKFREHYFLGDTVGLRGQYETVGTMRVIEHVETEDETGYHAYPTLSVD